jgi:rhombotail lipoprotein
VAFLFPNEQPLIQEPALPVLKLPLRVGLAFVPEERGSPDRFSEPRKQVLLQRIAADFRDRPFVQSIQTVPELYLRHGGGFENLDQLRGLLGIDVMVLLSYDQAQFSAERKSAIAYWTIVGAYFVNGNRNDTHTLMEATVYDIPSRTLLFHAPGVDLTRGNSSLVDLERELRANSAASLDRATAQLVKSLETELGTFQQSLKEGTAHVKVENRPGYSGAGAVDAVSVCALLAILPGALLALRRSNSLPARDGSLPAP